MPTIVLLLDLVLADHDHTYIRKSYKFSEVNLTKFFLDHFNPKLTQLYNAHVLLLEQNLQLLELNLDHWHPFQQHLSNGSNLQGRIDLDFKIYNINVEEVIQALQLPATSVKCSGRAKSLETHGEYRARLRWVS